MIKEQTVIVVDLSNYKSSYSEKIPFKGVLIDITNYPCYIVKSLSTGNEYELYESQLLEGLDIDVICRMMNMREY